MRDGELGRSEPHLLWESWILVCEIDGERVMTHQVIVERLAGDGWCVQTILGPRRLHRRHFATFDSTQDAVKVLSDLHARGQAVGIWHESRFGHESIFTLVTGSKPHW